MPEIGQLSGSLEEKEQGFKPRSRVYAGPDWGWQTEESYNKIVQQRNRGLGSEAVDFIEEKAGQAFGLISQIPGVKQGLDFAGGVVRFVDKTAIQPAIQAAEDPSQAGTPQALAGTVFKTGQMAEQGGAQIARNLGVDPRIGSAVAGSAYETVTGAAVGKLGRVADTLTPPGGGGLTPAMAGAGGPQLSIRGGDVNLQPPTVMKAVTTTVPEALEAAGVRTGDELMDARLGKQYTKRNRDVLAKENDIKYLKETLAGLDELKNDPKNLIKFINKNPELLETWNRYTKKYGADEAFSRTRANIAQRKTNADTAWSQLKSNVLPFEKDGEYRRWYGSDAAKPDRRRVETALRVKGDLKIKEYLQQHHLIPKGMTAAYFNKMDQLIAAGKAKPDDLIVMAQVALKKGMPTGDVKANLKDLIPAPHAELHTILRRQGDEIAKSKLIKDLSKINNVDDLMRLWVKEFSPEGKFTYNYETAKIFQELDSLLEEMTGISKNVRKRDVKEK